VVSRTHNLALENIIDNSLGKAMQSLQEAADLKIVSQRRLQSCFLGFKRLKRFEKSS
jgi:hypothetical protein